MIDRTQQKKDWYEKNKEKVLLNQKNKLDELRIYQSEWRKKNKEKIQSKNQKWYLENKSYMIEKGKQNSKKYDDYTGKNLSYGYIKNDILKIKGREKNNFLNNLIETKRLQIMILREVRNEKCN